jgi:hypothetical protein
MLSAGGSLIKNQRTDDRAGKGPDPFEIVQHIARKDTGVPYVSDLRARDEFESFHQSARISPEILVSV